MPSTEALPEHLVTVSTLKQDYSNGAAKEGLTLPHVSKSHHMEAKLAIKWVTRSRVEHSAVYDYHLEYTTGEIYDEQ